MATYKTSSLRLYYAARGNKWELLPHKLFIVDNIEDYLVTKTYYTVATFQYQKPQLELSITVDLSQTYAEPLNTSFKYVRIANEDQPTGYYYYFVKNVVWRSKSAVRFDLVMDVLNTFKENEHYTFKASTNIIREHKDRFALSPLFIEGATNVLSGVGTLQEDDEVDLYYETIDSDWELIAHCKINYYDYDEAVTLEVLTSTLTPVEIETIITREVGYNTTFQIKKNNSNYDEFQFDSIDFQYDVFRKIDYIQENINPLLQCGTAVGRKIEHKESILQKDWYLLYRNVNDPSESQASSLVNPVECFLIPSAEINTNAGYIQNGRLIPSWLEEGKYYYFNIPSTNNFTLSNGVVLNSVPNPRNYTIIDKRIAVLTKSNNKICVVLVMITHDTNTPVNYFCEAIAQYDDVDYITIASVPVNYMSHIAFYPTLYSTYNAMTFSETFNNSGTENKLDPITKLDRTDAKNIKLIKLPYAPYKFTVSGTTLQIASDTNWEYVSLTQSTGGPINCLRLYNLNTKLTVDLNDTYGPTNSLIFSSRSDFNPAITDSRLGMDYESKLFNSEFYRACYVYDSFQFGIQLEKCDLDYYINTPFFSSNFKIKFDVTRTINSKFLFTYKDYVQKLATENYANVMPIARNNEEVLYNVPYINYIRTGFNYDVKAKNISTASAVMGAVMSTVGTVAAFAAPSASLKAIGVVTGLISMAMATKNAITTVIQNEDSIKRKLKEAEMQTASVAGSDDVDLMSEYAENRLKYLVYEPNPVMKSMLYDLFFYAGYASNRMGLPSHNTRVNFDYLECNAIIEKVANIPDDCLTELINAFKNGVTYIHKTSRALNKWDFAQEYENWESFLVED